MTNELLIQLAKVKALFQHRAIIAAMGMEYPQEQHVTCGDYATEMQQTEIDSIKASGV